MKRVEWVVKASKFCNLRCAYCYEWNSLGDKDRLSLDDWRRVLQGVRDFHLDLRRRLGDEVISRLIWHGGEPLVLPAAYLDEVMTLQHEVLNGLNHKLLLQTNLYRLPERSLDLLKRHKVGLGVSMDVIGGARLNRRGDGTEAAVVANMDRLERMGVVYGAITVVAKHNHRRLRDVHDFWARRRVDFRVLPLFEGPDERPAGLFEVSEDQLVAALCDLFDHWIAAGAVVDVLPLSEWLGNVLGEILGRKRPVYDRRRGGENVWLVETNGDLHQTDERGRPDLRLGNLARDTIREILAGPAYEVSLRRSEQKSARFCDGCRHYGFCDGYPVHAEPITAPPAGFGGCPVTSAVHDHIKRHLLAEGYGPAKLFGMLRASAGALA